MSVYVRTTRNKLFVLEVQDAGLDEVAEAVREWIDTGAVQVYHLADLARYVVNWGREELVMISRDDPTEIDPVDESEPAPRIVKFPILLHQDA